MALYIIMAGMVVVALYIIMAGMIVVALYIIMAGMVVVALYIIMAGMVVVALGASRPAALAQHELRVDARALAARRQTAALRVGVGTAGDAFTARLGAPIELWPFLSLPI